MARGKGLSHLPRGGSYGNSCQREDTDIEGNNWGEWLHYEVGVGVASEADLGDKA